MIPEDEQPIQPFPFNDVSPYLSEIESDGSADTGRQPEVNVFDD